MNTLNISGNTATTHEAGKPVKANVSQPVNDEGQSISSGANIEQKDNSSLFKAVESKDNVNALNKNEPQVKGERDKSDAEVLEDVASNLQEFVNLIDKELKFTVDTDTGRHIVTVKDGASGEVIRQIPSEEVLKLAQNLAKITDVFTVSGKLLETKV